MKLSDKQKEVVSLMRDGWELGHTTGFVVSTWLQQNGLGKGGKTKDISYATLNALHDKKIIYFNNKHSQHALYSLTELGKTIQL